MVDCVGYRTEVSEISSLIERVERAHKRLSETVNVMQATVDRVLGSLPEPADQDEYAVPTDNLINAFNAALDIFEADLERAKALANRLARL